MAQPVMWTYQDAVERLLDAFDLRKKSDRDLRLAREAVLNAYRAFPTENMSGWKYYRRQFSFHTEAAYSEGTIEYDAVTRIVTLTDGEWPLTAAFGVLQIGQQRYLIETYVDEETLILEAGGAPPDNIAAGTSYTWFRESYPVPCDWRANGRLIDSDAYRPLQPVSPNELLLRNRSYDGTIDRAEYYAWENDSNYFLMLAITLGPPPNSVRKYDYSMKAEGRPLVVRGVNSTGSVPIAGTTVTLTTPAFDPETHYGAVIRFSGNADPPSNKIGYINLDNPFVFQRRLVSISAPTQAELDSPIASGAGIATPVGVSISDPLDVEEGSMLNAFWAFCDYHFAKMIRHKDLAKYHAWYRQELLTALQADQRDDSIQTGYMDGSGDGTGLPLGNVDVSY